MSDIPKVALHYLSFIHYRKSLFYYLQSENDSIDFNLLCGQKSPYGVRSFQVDQKYEVKNRTIGRLIWQSGLLRKTFKLNPDVVVLLGVNPLIISSLFYFWILKITGIKVYWWGHGTLGNQGFLGKKLRLLYYQMADGTLVYGERGKSILLSHGIPEHKVHVIYNCLNIEDYGSDKKKSLLLDNQNEEPLTLLFSGRLTKAKQVSLLLRAIDNLNSSHHDRIKVNIIGEGPELEDLKKESSSLGLNDCVKFHGALYGDTVRPFFENADVFVHPGSIGLATIHALSFGLPIITHNKSELQKPEAECITNAYNGFLFEFNDVDSLTGALLTALSLSNERRKELITHCKKSIENYYPEIVAERFTNAVTSNFRK